MKSKFLILVIGCFLCLSYVTAQVDTSAPTKEDALNFIKKVYNENYELGGLKRIDVRLDGCYLNISINYYDGPIHENHYGDFTDNIKINLSEVRLVDMPDYDKTGIGQEYEYSGVNSISHLEATEGAAITYNNIINSNGEKDDEYSRDSPFPYEMGFYYINGESNHDELYTRIIDISNSNVYKIKELGQRLTKAYQFLINACGGGKVKDDSNDKF